MKQTVIGIMSLPPIIESGVSQILGKSKAAGRTIHRIDESRAMEQTARLRPSVIITDPLLAGHGIIDAIRSATDGPSPKFIGIQHCSLPKSTLELFDAVVSLYDPAPELETAIEKLAAKEPDDMEEKSSALSQREKDVVVSIAKGMSNKEIAAQMNVSVNTVMTHRRNISAKLKIHSPAGITIYAIVSKLVKLEEIRTQLP